MKTPSKRTSLNSQRILIDGRRLLLQLICAVSVMAMVVGSFFLVLRPYQARTAQAAAEALENYRLHEKSHELQATREDLRQQSTALAQQLRSRYDKPCPADKPLMQVITELVGEAHLQLVSFSEQPIRIDGGMNIPSGTTADLRISGGYQELCRWLNGLQHLERPVRVVALQLSPRTGEGDECSAHLELQFYNQPVLRSGESRLP